MTPESDAASLLAFRDVAARAARAGGDAVRAIDRTDASIGYKTPLDVTTSADRAAHAAVLDVLVREYPDHAVRGEDGDRGPDGSSVGLRHHAPGGSGQTVAAAVHDPVHGELYDAALGAGARRDGRSIAVPDAATLDRAGPSWPPRSRPPIRTSATASSGSSGGWSRTVPAYGSRVAAS